MSDTNKEREALERLMKSFPTDDDMKMAGWEDPEINEACDAYSAAREVLSHPTPAALTAQAMGEKAQMRQALEHCLNWLPEDCAAACEARAVLALAPGLSGWVSDELEEFLKAQDALDNHELNGQNGVDYFTLVRRRNAARKDLDAVLSTAPGIAPHQPQPEGKPWDMKTAHEKAPELIAQLDEESERLTRYGGSGDALLNEAARVIEALTQPQPEPTSKGAQSVEDFKQWLNANRMLDVSMVFHEVVDRYEAALSSSQQREPQEAGKAEQKDWIRSMNLEADIRRVIGWEKPINDFDVVKELQEYIALLAASKEAGKVEAVADERQPSDGDYLRWAEQAGAKVNWDFESASSARVVFLTASQWGRFCDKVRALYLRPSQQALSDEEIISQGRVFSTNNEYAHGRCTSLEFTPTGLVMLVRAILGIASLGEAEE